MFRLLPIIFIMFVVIEIAPPFATAEDKKWGRNPFLTHQEKAVALKPTPLPQVVPAPEPPSPSWEVRGIIIGPEYNIAILNGQIVGVGDTLGSEKILEIERRGITLDSGGKRRILQLKERSLLIVVKEYK